MSKEEITRWARDSINLQLYVLRDNGSITQADVKEISRKVEDAIYANQ